MVVSIVMTMMMPLAVADDRCDADYDDSSGDYYCDDAIMGVWWW